MTGHPSKSCAIGPDEGAHLEDSNLIARKIAISRSLLCASPGYHAALAGLGIIMVPTWMIRDELKHAHLVPVLEDFPLVPPSTPIHAVFAHNRHLAPKVRADGPICRIITF